MDRTELDRNAAAMVAPGKGILAADESTGTIKKRFDRIGLESTFESRRAYRELLFTAPEAERYISGVILFDETIRQQTADGRPFPAVLASRGILPGIKVDAGAKPLAGFPGEKVTEGLDGLRERLAEYRGLGARFAKWRAVIDVSPVIPTPAALAANSEALARYAALCQEASIVPIVEPEVLMDGDHSIERCEEATDATLETVFDALFRHRVRLEGMVLKPNMVIAGKKCTKQATPQEVADATVRCLRRRVPAAVPGIAFLSGGQSEAEATLHLSLMNRVRDLPWQLSFSYGRALQQSTLEAWRGSQGNVAAAQRAFQRRAKLNGMARSGSYEAAMEQAAA